MEKEISILKEGVFQNVSLNDAMGTNVLSLAMRISAGLGLIGIGPYG